LGDGDGAGLSVGHRRGLPLVEGLGVAPAATGGVGELVLVVAQDVSLQAQYVPHVEGEDGEQQDGERRMQRPPQLVLADGHALAAATGEMLLHV
jgi:hypothetical protein